jgi:hypothetical protein
MKLCGVLSNFLLIRELAVRWRYSGTHYPFVTYRILVSVVYPLHGIMAELEGLMSGLDWTERSQTQHGMICSLMLRCTILFLRVQTTI